MPDTEKGTFGLPVQDPDELVSRRQFIAESVMANLIKDHGQVTVLDVLMVREGISSIAVEHPDWDMDGDLRTRAVWLKSEDVI